MRDETLRHLLRRNAMLSPGNCHYYVQWVDGSTRTGPSEQKRRVTQSRSRFETYNLLTLYLTNAEIASLGRLVTASPDVFLDKAEKAGMNTKYVYYLTGVPGVGKTSIVRHLGSLATVDEWAEPPLPLMMKPFTELTATETERVDDWIARQFSMKNEKLFESREGFFVIDRPPLDPISFTPSRSWKRKARLLKKALRSKQGVCVQNGHVFLLTGDPKEIHSRFRSGKRSGGWDYLEGLEESIKKVYKGQGVTPVDTEGLGLQAVVGVVAKAMFLDEYSEFNLEGRLDEIDSHGA
jgi:hypothetical protein